MFGHASSSLLLFDNRSYSKFSLSWRMGCLSPWSVLPISRFYPSARHYCHYAMLRFLDRDYTLRNISFNHSPCTEGVQRQTKQQKWEVRNAKQVVQEVRELVMATNHRLLEISSLGKSNNRLQFF